MNYRFIYSDNGLLTDYSTPLAVYHSNPIDLEINHEQDCLYVGSPYPFNSIYFKVSTVAASSLAPTIAYWQGSAWQNAIELIDETEGFTQSGYLTWQIHRGKSSWTREDTVDSNLVERVTGLGDVSIYDMYWTKISFGASDDISLKWAGHKFITDNDLKVEYPQFGNTTLLSAIQAGKTDWDEQIVRASKLVIEDLISQRIILSSSQILDRRKLESMTVSKTAEVIYMILGDDYVDQRREASIEYARRLKSNSLNVDIDNNADLSMSERSFRQGYLYR
jgi:hypothetical protein